MRQNSTQRTDLITTGERDKWDKEIDASRKEREKFTDLGMKTLKRYAADDKMKGSVDYNLFFSTVETKQAAIYARTPQPDISRRNSDADDDVSRVAAMLLQRTISTELDIEGFDQKFSQITFDRLVPGLGVGWLRLEQDLDEPQFDPLTGQQFIPVKDELAYIDYVGWNDFFWAPCKTWGECPWVARRVQMTKDAVKDAFPHLTEDQLNDLSFQEQNSGKQYNKDKIQTQFGTQKLIEVFEIWDKTREVVIWYTESLDVPLDVVDDTMQFDGFFPTPLPPLCRTTTASTTPISDFKLLQDLYNELDNLNTRITNLQRSLQLKWAYDQSNKELADLFTSTKELQGVPVKDWAVFKSEKGGIAGSMEFAPLEMQVMAYRELLGAREQIKQQIYEIEGISDILRGAATPYETATATQAKTAFSSTRISVMQRQVAEYIAALLRLKAHVITKFYKPETILERAGTLAQSDQPLLMPAIQLLKNEQMRNLKLNVSVDSIQLENWNQQSQERISLVKTVGDLIAQSLPAIQQVPELAPLMMKMVQFGVAGFKGADVVEGEIDAFLNQLVQKTAQGAQQPPEPTPEQVKAQAAQQTQQAMLAKTQMQEQTKLQVAQLEASLKSRDQEIEMLKAQIKAQEVQHNIQHDNDRLMMDRVDGAHKQAMDRNPGPGAL